MAVVTPGTSFKRILDAQSLALGVLLGLELLEMFARTGLQLGRGLLVEALDRGKLVEIDEGDLLDGGEALGGEQLADHLVDVEGGDEELRTLLELLLAALRLLLLGEDVDVPAGELGGEAHVLATTADGERELFVGHHHLDALGILVEDHLGDLGRLQGVDDEGGGIRLPRDDVDLLALELVDHRLHAAAAHADAGADRVDGGIARDDGDLGAASRDRGRPSAPR